MTPRGSLIQAVVFDLDDTLFPERQYVYSGYWAAADRLRTQLGRTERFEDWLWMRFLRGQAKGAFEALNEAFDLNLPSGEIEALVNVYREHSPCIRPFGGTPDLLGRLRQEYKLALLSDGYMPGQRNKFQALNLERFFDAVIFTEEMGRECWKPSTRGFERLQEILGVAGAACAYIGDNPSKDFLPVNTLGWRSIQYLRPQQVYASNPAPEGGRPQFIIRDPEELYRNLLT